MAAIISNIGPYFDKKEEKCSDYADPVEAYVAVNDIDNDKKLNVFLAVIGPDPYKFLKNLCDQRIQNQEVYPVVTSFAQPVLHTTFGRRHKEKAKVCQNSW